MVYCKAGGDTEVTNRIALALIAKLQNQTQGVNFDCRQIGSSLPGYSAENTRLILAVGDRGCY